MKTRSCVWVLVAALLLSLLGTSGFSVVADEQETSVVPEIHYFSQPVKEDYADCLGIGEAQLAQLKTMIFEAAIGFEAFCDISSFQIPLTSRTNEVLSDIVYKNDPEVFHIQEISFTYRVSGQKEIITQINFVAYKYEKDAYEKRLAACRRAADELLDGIVDSDLTDVQKALLLHDRLAVLCAYDYASCLTGNVPEQRYTIYGALVEQKAVCEGYAQAYKHLIDQVGIENYLCTSLALGHVWNILKIDGTLYHVDVTWDDPVEDITGRVSHRNFLRSSSGMYQTGHNAGDYDTTPRDETYDNAFWQESNTAFQLVDGAVYFIDNNKEMLRKWVGDNIEDVCSVKDTWFAGESGIWPGNYARLGSDASYLYYSLSNGVYQYDPATGKSALVFQPDLSGYEYFSIFGFAIVGNTFCCDVNNSPNFTADTKQEHQICYTYRQAKAVSLAVSKAPAKTVYRLGEALDTTGLHLTVTYDNGTTETVTTGFTASGYDASREGAQTVTVTYGAFTASYEVVVKAAEALPDVGDVDGDNAITSTDARLTLQIYAGKIGGEGMDLSFADVDHDGTITSTDARLILQYYAGKITVFP